jgi:hypothetical protein
VAHISLKNNFDDYFPGEVKSVTEFAFNMISMDLPRKISFLHDLFYIFKSFYINACKHVYLLPSLQEVG